jgi:serine protease Do
MKRPSAFWTWTALAVLAITLGLPAAMSDTSAGPTTAKTSADKSAAPIGYVYDTAPIDRSNAERLTSYADMLDQVTPAVVSVYTSRKVSIPLSGGSRMQNYLRRMYNLSPDATDPQASVERTIPNGVGSGCIISSDGYILTDHHVVTTDDQGDLADDIVVKLPDGREFDAKLIGADELTDVALLKIDAKDLPTIKLADSDKLKVGDIVFAVGNPLDVGLTVTKGIVSALGRTNVEVGNDAGFEDYIQTDASINLGNSGGPLVDADGRLIGLNTAIYSTDQSGGSIGIGFAIPSALARHVVDGLIKDGQVKRGSLGVKLQDLDRNLAEAMGLPNTHGALLSEVDPAAPAGRAGIERGDVVVKMDGQEVDSPGKLRYLVALDEPGQTVNLTVMRDGKEQGFKVRLGDWGAMYGAGSASANQSGLVTSAAPNPRATPSGLLGGVTLEPLTPELLQQENLPNTLNGLLITRMSPVTAYEDLNAGMVIVEVNNHPVTSLVELKAQLKPGAVNIFYVYDPANTPNYEFISELVSAATGQ